MSVTELNEEAEFGGNPLDAVRHSVSRATGYLGGLAKGVTAASQNGKRGMYMADIRHIVKQVGKAHERIRKQQMKIIDDELQLVQLHKELLEVSRKHGISVKQTLGDLNILSQREDIERTSKVIEEAFREIGESISTGKLVREDLVQTLDNELDDAPRTDAELVSAALTGNVEDEQNALLDARRNQIEQASVAPPRPRDQYVPLGYPVYNIPAQQQASFYPPPPPQQATFYPSPPQPAPTYYPQQQPAPTYYPQQQPGFAYPPQPGKTRRRAVTFVHPHHAH